jgi:Domain of unknown function (DUF2341)
VRRLFALCCVLFVLTPALASASGPGWAWRVPLVVRNNNADELSFFQVRVELDLTLPPFTGARADLADLRFTDESGARNLPHWLERIEADRAVIWVKVTRLPANADTTIYAYIGNAHAITISSGWRTFEFFDDFDQPGAGYFPLGPARTVMVKDLPWETQAPHTLTVVELNRDGWRYWGYYGLADCGGIGLARSNDLLTWEKSPQPLLNMDGERWPSASFDGSRVWMVYDRDHCQTSHLVLRTSTDGLTFDPGYTVLVAQEPGVRNQNPHLFRDPSDGRYYLYWFRGGEAQGYWQLKARVGRTPYELADPSSERVLLEEPYTLAAPNMLFHEGVYYFSTEVNENAWKTKIYASPSPLGPFAPLPGAMVLTDNEACWFQHVFEGQLHGYYCKDTRGDGQGWVLNHRVGDLTRRETGRRVDRTFWSIESGDWRVDSGRLTGASGAVLRAHIPIGAGRLAEYDTEAGLRTVNPGVESLLLDGSAQAWVDNVRIRKWAAEPPGVRSIGPAERRARPDQAWFDVGNRVSPVSGPGSRPAGDLFNPIWLAGPLILMIVVRISGVMNSKRIPVVGKRHGNRARNE